MSTVRDLTSVGVMETKTQPFGTLGGYPGNLPSITGTPAVYTTTTDDAQVSTKIFNFGHGSYQFPAGAALGQINEIALQPYRLGNPQGNTASDVVAASGTGPSQVVGKEIFARNSHLTIHLRYAVPDLAYQWSSTGGTGNTSSAGYFKGSPTWYTPINYRLLLVKFKRDKWPSAGNAQTGGDMAFFGAPLLDNQNKSWYKEGNIADEPAIQCSQSPANRCLFIDHYGGYFGVGNLQGTPTSPRWANQKFSAYEAMSQPVATKYWEVIHEKKGTIKPPAVLPPYDIDMLVPAPSGNVTQMQVQTAVPTAVYSADAPLLALGQVIQPTQHAGIGATAMQNIGNPQSTTKPYKTLKLSLPWNDRFSMTKSAPGGITDKPGTEYESQAYICPSDECLEDIKLVLICDRPTFADRAKQNQNKTHKSPVVDPATKNYQCLQENFMPQIEISISGVSTYTDA